MIHFNDRVEKAKRELRAYVGSTAEPVLTSWDIEKLVKRALDGLRDTEEDFMEPTNKDGVTIRDEFMKAVLTGPGVFTQALTKDEVIIVVNNAEEIVDEYLFRREKDGKS